MMTQYIYMIIKADFPKTHANNIHTLPRCSRSYLCFKIETRDMYFFYSFILPSCI